MKEKPKKCELGCGQPVAGVWKEEERGHVPAGRIAANQTHWQVCANRLKGRAC